MLQAFERLDGRRKTSCHSFLLLGTGKLWMTQLDSGLLNSGGAMCLCLSVVASFPVCMERKACNLGMGLISIINIVFAFGCCHSNTIMNEVPTSALISLVLIFLEHLMLARQTRRETVFTTSFRLNC